MIFFISIFVTFISIIFLRPYAKKVQLIDLPSKRKVHSGEIPIIGGICIFIGFNISVLGHYNDFNLMLACSFIGFFILLLGLIDDFYPLSPLYKILAQISIISLMVYATGYKFDTFGHSFGLTNQISLGLFSYPVTILGIVFVINAYNLMDGTDGLLGLLVFLALVGIKITDIIDGIYFIHPIFLALMGSLISFLWFNLITNRNKIFLGDAGSLYLGYIISFLLLYKTQNSQNFSPTYALWIIAIPVFDAISVILYRFKKSRELFIPDRNHLHHFLQRLGFSNKLVISIIFCLGLLILLLGLLIEYNYRFLSFPVFVFVFIFFIWVRVYSRFSKFNL